MCIVVLYIAAPAGVERVRVTPIPFLLPGSAGFVPEIPPKRRPMKLHGQSFINLVLVSIALFSIVFRAKKLKIL